VIDYNMLSCSYCYNSLDSAPDGIHNKLSGGQALPYSATCHIRHRCMSCINTSADNNAEGGKELATVRTVRRHPRHVPELYQASGKCENNKNLNKRTPAGLSRALILHQMRKLSWGPKKHCWFYEDFTIW